VRLFHHPFKLTIVRFPPDAEVPAWADAGRFSSISRTPHELSIVCERHLVPDGSPEPWDLLEVEGPLAHSLVGIMAGLTVPLAGAGLSVFAIATHDTDWLLIRSSDIGAAVEVLTAAGYRVEPAPS